jgi:hypothetical protein
MISTGLILIEITFFLQLKLEDHVATLACSRIGARYVEGAAMKFQSTSVMHKGCICNLARVSVPIWRDLNSIEEKGIASLKLGVAVAVYPNHFHLDMRHGILLIENLGSWSLTSTRCSNRPHGSIRREVNHRVIVSQIIDIQVPFISLKINPTA